MEYLKKDPITILAMLMKLGHIKEKDIINTVKTGLLDIDEERMEEVVKAIKLKKAEIDEIDNLIKNSSAQENKN
jgi:hypothetical protein